MSGRRGYERFAVVKPWEGSVSLLRDVIVQREAAGQLTVISRTAGVEGEVLRLDVSGGGEAATVRVRVIDSRPVAIAGAVQHAVRLTVLDAPCPREFAVSGHRRRAV